MINKITVCVLASQSLGILLIPHYAVLLGASGLVWCAILTGRAIFIRSQDIKKRIRDGDSPSFLFRISFDTKKD